MGNWMSLFNFFLCQFLCLKFNNKLEPNKKCKYAKSEDEFIL